MKSRLSRSILFILVLSLALQTTILPAFAQSESDKSQPEIDNLAVPQKIDQPSYLDERDSRLYPKDAFEEMPPELAERHQIHDEFGERTDAIPPSPEIIAKTKALVDSFDCATVTDVPQIECEALVALYESTNGAGWTNNTNWLQTTTVANWRGITAEMGRITRINLFSNQLTSNIPGELGNLSNLELLTLGFNQLTGVIPSELGLLSNLEVLMLGFNQLTGGIPAELGNLSNLEDLRLYNNQLSGSIPSTIGNLSNLENLALNDNPLTDSIPLSFINLTKLDYFNYAETNLCEPTTPKFLAWKNTVKEWQGTGVICVDQVDFDCTTVIDVPQIECEALVTFYQSTNGAGWYKKTNWLESTRVSTWHGVTVWVDSGVVGLNLFNNQLAGRIPAELGNLSNLKTLDLFHNQLAGSIPAELGLLSNLDYFRLSDNQLTGNIPTELGYLSNLWQLDLTNNQLTGRIPAELGNLSNLEYLGLVNNQLTGSIPEELGNLSKLSILYLYSNQLTGSIPTEIGNLSNLGHLGLNDNQLSGSIPAELGSLSNLETLYLSNNQLTGSIPEELGNLSNLDYLFFEDNQLTGSIPAELGNMYNLEVLYLGNNQLTGSIPAELGGLSKLHAFELHSNQLAGSIPLSFINLTKLDYFYFSETNLCEPAMPEFLTWKNTVDNWIGTGVICGENRLPVAVDDSYTNSFITNLVVSAPGVLSNDTDPDEDVLTATKLSDPASGTLDLYYDGSFTYTFEPGFSGTVSFTYKASDGEYFDVATVTIVVKPLVAIYLPMIIQ